MTGHVEPSDEATLREKDDHAGRRSKGPGVLVLDEEVPWPANTGKRLRTLNLLSALAEEFAIDLLVHANGASPAAVSELARRGVTVRVSRSQVPRKGGPLLPLRIAASVAAGLPYSVHSHYRAGFRRAMREQLALHSYQLIHCEWTPYALYARQVPIPVCIAAHNVESLIWQRMAQSEARPLHRQLFALQARLMHRFEHQIFTEFHHATAVSEGDAEAIRSLGCRDVVVVPNGVDADAYTPPPREMSEPRTLVFTGSMDWRPNQDAIRWFVTEVHPLLRARTEYRLFVVGRTPPAWLSDPAFVPPEVTVTGTVDDIQPWIAKAAVYVVPLRVGGGSRLKILEALAMARPVVSTAVGMEGLDLESGQHLLVEDSPADFAAAICALFEDEPRRQALGRAGRALIEARYRWDRIAPRQAALWRRAIDR